MDSFLDLRVSRRSIQDGNLYLLNSKILSDVVFLVGDTKEPIHAHKFILILSSPVFEVQFGGRWEQEDKIEIPDISPQAFRMFLEFVYADKFSVTENEAADVLFLAHKYMINCLAKKCCDFLESVINVSNIVHIYQTATEFDEKNLEMKAMEFILKNGSAAIEDIGFLQIDTDTLSKILKDDKLAAYEVKIFHALMRWAENKCKSEGLDLTVENKRFVLKDLIFLIRFTLMTSEEFTNKVLTREHTGILSDMESNAILEYLSAAPSARSQLPKLPFIGNKRYNGFLNKVNIYEAGVGYFHSNTFCTTKHNDASAGCEIIFGFRSSRNVCIRGIELKPSGSFGNYMNSMCLLLADFSSVPDPDCSGTSAEISLAEISHLERMKRYCGTFVPSSYSNLGFQNGFQIEKNTDYNIKLIIKVHGSMKKLPGAHFRFGKQYTNPTKISSPEGKVEFTFRTVSSKCRRQQEIDSSRHDMICISFAPFKTIHFTM